MQTNVSSNGSMKTLTSKGLYSFDNFSATVGASECGWVGCDGFSNHLFNTLADYVAFLPLYHTVLYNQTVFKSILKTNSINFSEITLFISNITALSNIDVARFSILKTVKTTLPFFLIHNCSSSLVQ